MDILRRCIYTSASQHMNWFKKLSVRIFIILYGASYLLQNGIFVDRKKVYAAEIQSTTNIVAVFVDKNIYESIKTNLVRYTTRYIQGKIDKSKAVVLPIDTSTLKAHEISQILENMYFEGLKDESSKLVGTILIGDIPLPVVENNGFIYPSIYPYVDFENQQFIYDTKKKFFVYNNNPNGQAEIWHGIIKFDTETWYNDFFGKVKSYYTNPNTFIDKAIWYEDFVGLKKYFIPENTKYYINSLLFSEDIGYHRFNNLLLNILKDEHNESTLELGNNLKKDLQDVEDTELKAYANDIETRNNQAAEISQDVSSIMPTLTLKKATQEMIKWYDGLISSQFLAKIKDNIGWLARRYKTTLGKTYTDYSSLTDKIVQKDNRILGDIDNELQPLIIQINDALESGLNTKIEKEKYYMTIPIPVSELDFEGKEKWLIQKKCTWKTYNYYENYLFGRNVNTISSAEETNIYRGTFQNLSSISGQAITNTGKSIGGSYAIFSTQVEANRWYDFNSTKEELERYAKYKTNKQDLRELKCTNYFLNWKWLGVCMKPRSRSVDDDDDQNKCDVNDQEKQWGCESLTGFSARNRWGASPMNMDATSQNLVNYNYKNAILPIYNIAGSRKIANAEGDANSYKSVMAYTTMIQKKFGVGDLQHGNNNVISLISNPLQNGSNLVFTNQLPIGDLENPTRIPNPPRTYTETSFFTQFGVLPYHILSGEKAVLYRINPGECWGNWSIYTYKTIDSRVKNISPTRQQISDTEVYKFKWSSDLNVFYTTVMRDLAQTKGDIIKKTNEFSGTNATDITGVIANLGQLKTLISGYNSSMQAIIAFNPTSLQGYSPTQLTQLANTRNENNINPTKSLEIKNRITKTNQGLEALLNYVNSLNINNVWIAYKNIIQSENFKNQKVELLDSWKTNITQNLEYITTNVNTLKSTFSNARGTYNTIGQLNNTIFAIQAKKTAIAEVVNCWTPPQPCGCDASHYKEVCDVLDTMITTLQTEIFDINDKIEKIQSYPGDTNEYGTPTIVQPFIEINQALSPADILWEIALIKSTMDTFSWSTDAEKKEKNKGMNLTTQDRPIDNIRNITFQGIGWDMVKLNYPNLYEVEIYKTVENKLIIKTPSEIREAIKTYLRNKVSEYNTVLEGQKNKKDQWYTSLSNQFTFLGQLDPLANPNADVHQYDLLPPDYFIDQIIIYLDTLENGPKYGKKAIYGQSKSTTIDEKLDMIAKLFYYQNITWPERMQQESVVEDMTEIKESFDINQKILHITKTYLTEGNDQGKFITPTYNTTGYEVGYINSDGEDYVSAKTTPSFIKQIQTAQENATNTPTKVNQFTESSATDLQAEVDSCEWVDTQGTALLFDFKTFSSPWSKAMVCWAKKVWKKPLDIKVSFKNALGPIVVWSSLKDIIQNTTGYGEDIGNQRKEYGEQRNIPDNEEIINQTEGNIKETLQWYNNNVIVHIDKTIIWVDDDIGVDTTGNAQIKIGMAQDMGTINIKISGTGDNCFGLRSKGKPLSRNICTDKAQAYYNPNTEENIFDIVIGQNKKAGSTALKIELCPAIGDACIIKQQVINIMPGPIETIELQWPSSVMEGAEIPLIVSASDKYGNKIHQSIQAYTISVQSGDGKIYDGSIANRSITFDNFSTAGFIYQAPIGIQDNKEIIVTILEDQTEKRLWANENTSLPKVVQKKITVAKGIVTVQKNNIILYQTDNKQNIQPKITFTLPKNESDIQYQDADDIVQIKPENIPSLIVSLVDKKGNKLDTVANITSKQGMLIPWIIKEKSIIKNNSTKKQIAFVQSNDFLVTSGKLQVTLYPSFKAGNDTITINIPGVDPIIIPVTVHPWAAKTVLLKLEKSRMDLTTTTTSKWTIHVVDTRNNKVTTGTTIKLWVIGSAKSNVSEFIYSGNEYTYTITATGAGGEWYVFAYIKDRTLTDQVPGYERFIIQESVLPKDKLNIMYLNLFWTDWGNQRWYFSENNKTINAISMQSNKLLAATTQLVDPNKIKQIEYIINPHGQIQNISIKESTLTIENKEFIVLMPEIAKIHLGMTERFEIQTLRDSWAASQFEKNKNTVLYIPEPTDSVITGNETTKSKIIINGIDVIDLTKSMIDPRLTISADNEMIADMSSYTLTMNSKIIGKIMIWNNDNITTNTANIDIQDPITYGQTPIFSEWSTNTQGIGIYIHTSAFSKQGYESIEDSSDALLGIWFTSKFKNVANFANGKSVGEATLPYGSHFLINFWDPLLERREKNPKIPDTDFDASIGQTIYADPNKTIFKVLPIDFNNDGSKDLIVVYTDGVIKLVKNYWGTQAYKNLQELMIIAEPIKEIKIGDVDGNGFEDIFIITNNNKGIVYLNDKGIFTVDGKNVCLNVNTEPDIINPNPEDFSNIKQMFVEDMDKDGSIDIISNDAFGDIKVFYGGSTNNGANYLSSITWVCDSNRYTRQKNNYNTIKRFGIKLKNDRYIQDNSLIHRKWVEIPTEGRIEEKEIEAPDTTVGMSEEQMKALKTQAMKDIKDMVANTDMYVAAWSTQLAYTDNPLSTAPIYENLPAEEISYLPINENNDAVSIYKEYSDINGWILRQDDEVVIKTTIISKRNNNKLTYIDQLQGPRSIHKDTNNKITSLILSGNTWWIIVDRNGPEGYQFVLDNIQLNSWATLSFSYRVKYQAPKSMISIDVKDQDIIKSERYKDEYPDITINSTDACQKNRWIFFNNNKGNKRTYEQVYDDIQSEINQYNSWAQAGQETAMNSIVDQLANVDSLESLSTLPGMENMEKRSAKNLLSSLVSQEGISLDLNMNFIDDATAGVSKKLDTALQGLCQWFILGEWWCQGVPVPFNQAFLAPGDYHIFWCVPQIPNPLYPVFRTLNTTIGKGMPVLNIPGNRPSPVGYLPIPGIFWFPFKGTTDGFFLGTPGGLYPSQFRLYIAPTLTLGLGMAMCFGPYTVGKALPKPFRDLWGNCIVFALPPLTTCSTVNTTGTINQPNNQSLWSSMVAAAGQWTCNNPPRIGNTIVFAGDTQTATATNTANSPFQLVAAGSSENNPNYSAAIPQGNFWWLIAMDQDPIHVTASEDYGNAEEQITQGSDYEGYDLQKWEKINLKIVGAKTKGLVKCVVQDWMTRQVQYIQNNLTKMTIQLDLPDATTILQWFDKIGNLQETYKAINEADNAAGYISADGENIDITPNNTWGDMEWLSKKQINTLSQKVGKNPFEAIQQMFNEVPLINIESKDLTIKVPALTSEDINKYVSYLTLRVEKNGTILEERTSMLNETLAMCGATDKAEAKATIKNLEAIYATLPEKDKADIGSRITSEIQSMQKIIDFPKDPSTRQEMGADIQNIWINLKNTSDKITKLPHWKSIQTKLSAQKLLSGSSFTKEDQARLDGINEIIANLEKCSNIAWSMDGFLSFRENTAGLIRSVKANINVLEKYKEFPTQLYQWTHLTDRYLTEISALISDFAGGINDALSVNATRYSQYVDAITLIIGSIKTWQAIIDFSVNRSEKCSKCSNDNYGSFSCSLSFLCPKLPIFPIPAFKIPNIYMDISHVELGMDIVLPKVNFVPIKIPLPQIPNLPEPPSVEVDRDLAYGLDIKIFKEMSLPTIPVIPEPPTLPEPPSFIPSIKMDLPVLPPAPKIPKILPEINATLKVADFIGKIFCIVKWGIGLVGEKGVKGKIEQITQRTWNVPVFDYFNLTTTFNDPPLQWFDYKLDAYTTLKFNFDGVYDVFNSIAQTTNNFVSKQIESPIQKAIQQTTEKLNDNAIISGLDAIEDFDQKINFNGFNMPSEETTETTETIEYKTAYNELKKWLITFKNSANTDKKMSDRVKTILATVENKSTILPATTQIQQVEKTAKGIIDTKIQENAVLQKEIQNYDNFIKNIRDKNIVLVDNKTISTSLKAPILTIDSATKNILQAQEDPTKTYLDLNKKMVQGYLDAVNNDGAEKLNMSATTYKKSKKYLETTKEKIDTALLAYTDKPLLAQTQGQWTCTNCSTPENEYSTDISAYVQGVFIESYSGSENSSGSQKMMVNTMVSSEQIQKVQQTYTTNNDLNNDKIEDILMYDANSIYIKYAKQEAEHFSKWGSEITKTYTNFYSYASEHAWTWIAPERRYISSLEQLRNNSDAYGYTTINDITLKIIDQNKEAKNFKTEGQTFDNLQLSRENSTSRGEIVDGYIIKVSDKIDDKDTPNSFRDFLSTREKPKYIIVLPKESDYKKWLITIDENLVKKSINLQLGEKILAVEYYDPAQTKIQVVMKDLPRKWLYTSLATLTINQEDLNANQRNSLILYKKTSPRSNQTVAGMQNLGDVTAPTGEIILWRNVTNEAISTGVAHDGFINTMYTLKSLWTDNVLVSKMIIQKDGKTILEKENTSQTGTIDIWWLFFTWNTQQRFEFIAIDQNNNITKESVSINIKTPDIEVLDVKKTGEETADIIAKISNDLDEWTVIFQRLRNGIRKNIEGSNQNSYGGFDLVPKQTIITGGIFTLGNDIGLYDNQGNEIATIDPKTGEIKINPWFENKIHIHVSFATHIPVIELRENTKNIVLFQIVLPIQAIKNIEMHENKPNYEQIQLPDGQFGDFSNGYCIKNRSNDCIIYTNSVGAIYIPGIYASSLLGEYSFDTKNKQTSFIVKDQSNKPITTITVEIRATK